MNDYRAFALVVETGSVAAAARALGVPRPTISRRLSRLEEQLGARLVERGPRSLVVTRTGQQFYQRIRGALRTVEQATAEVREQREGPSGRLRIAVAQLIARPLAPFFRRFRAQYPNVSLEVITGNTFASLTAEGFDAALRAGVLRNPDLIQRRLRTVAIGAYAAPDYLAQHGTPKRAADLAQHAILRGTDPDGEARGYWPLKPSGHVEVRGGFVINDRMMLREAAILGEGIALMSDHLAAAAVATDQLQPVLPDRVGTALNLHVVYPSKRHLPARTRVFVDAVVAQFDDWEMPGVPL